MQSFYSGIPIKTSIMCTQPVIVGYKFLPRRRSRSRRYLKKVKRYKDKISNQITEQQPCAYKMGDILLVHPDIKDKLIDYIDAIEAIKGQCDAI